MRGRWLEPTRRTAVWRRTFSACSSDGLSPLFHSHDVLPSQAFTCCRYSPFDLFLTLVLYFTSTTVHATLRTPNHNTPLATDITVMPPRVLDARLAELRTLGVRIAKEQQRWKAYLTRIHASDTSLRRQDDPNTPVAVMALHLDSRLNAYNARVAALGSMTGKSHATMSRSWIWLLTSVTETIEYSFRGLETASSLLRRVLTDTGCLVEVIEGVVGSLEEKFTSYLQHTSQLHGKIYRAFRGWRREIMRPPKEGYLSVGVVKERERTVLRILKTAEGDILSLKCWMAKLGMPMPRQRLLVEFFSWSEDEVESEGASEAGSQERVDERPGDASSQKAVAMIQTVITDFFRLVDEEDTRPRKRPRLA